MWGTHGKACAESSEQNQKESKSKTEFQPLGRGGVGLSLWLGC